MANIIIDNVSSYKISNVVGENTSIVTFHSDNDIQAYSINVLGVSHDTGVVADSHSLDVVNLKTMTVAETKLQTVKQLKQIDANTIVTTQLNSTEMYQEGQNRINLYVKDMSGNWNNYES